MTLVAYSDSEGSDTEPQKKPSVKAAFQPEQNQPGAIFAINKSNPRKIRVSLTSSAPSSQQEDEERTPKRAKIGNGGSGGFNSMLPAPKREAEKKPTPNGTIRKIFNLKTGAEPGFSREADSELRQLFAEQVPVPQPNETSPNGNGRDSTFEPPKTITPMRFKPLSVSRNTKKRPVTVAQSKEATRSISVISQAPTPPAPAFAHALKPKVSLFSVGLDAASFSSLEKGDDARLADLAEQHTEDTEGALAIPTGTNEAVLRTISSQRQSLDTIASDLNLSAVDRRRLFGREAKGSTSAINVVNFNMDQEYAANEALRASGEQVQHHAVRGIAPGKHSLKQLVNAATTQKDALEESFAAGKSNKREAGSRYGW